MLTLYTKCVIINYNLNIKGIKTMEKNKRKCYMCGSSEIYCENVCEECFNKKYAISICQVCGIELESGNIICKSCYDTHVKDNTTY